MHTIVSIFCFKKVPMECLHPEAILRNLEYLRRHLEREVVDSLESGVDVALPNSEDALLNGEDVLLKSSSSISSGALASPLGIVAVGDRVKMKKEEDKKKDKKAEESESEKQKKSEKKKDKKILNKLVLPSRRYSDQFHKDMIFLHRAESQPDHSSENETETENHASENSDRDTRHDIASEESDGPLDDWEDVSRNIPFVPIGNGEATAVWSKPAWLTDILPTNSVWDLASNLKSYQQR
jgi:hypothetical protein